MSDAPWSDRHKFRFRSGQSRTSRSVSAKSAHEMAAITRTNSRPPKQDYKYKEYVSFLESYKGGKKDDQISIQSSDSGISVKNFPLSNSSNNTSSSSLNSDVADFAKTSCVSYNNYLENCKNKKFNSVKPNLEDGAAPKTMRTEVYIEVQNTVSTVSKMFERSASADEQSPSRKSGRIGQKISMFERQVSKENPRRASESAPKQERAETKPLRPSNSATTPPPPPTFENKSAVSEKPAISMPKPHQEEARPQFSSASVPPPPPMMPADFVAPKAQPAPVRRPQAEPAPIRRPQAEPAPVRRPQAAGGGAKAAPAAPIDRNDPMIRKLVYGTLRGMYAAHHEKANDFVATLPRNMVKKDNGIQNIIDHIASNGDLEKLNGRINPKLEQE